jgi:hypothetical protein
MNKNYCFTLSYNLFSEVEIATKLLYDLNDKSDFQHVIVDLDFPLEKGDEIPGDIVLAQRRNSIKLKHLAEQYGSEYMRIPNVGVSQNYTKVYQALNLDDTDIMVGVDPDERPQNQNWVRAMGNVMRSDMKIAMCSLMITAHKDCPSGWAMTEQVINSERCYIMHGNINWAIIGLNGEFFNKIHEMPVPSLADRYGYLEWALYALFSEHGYDWVVMSDYWVEHEWSCPIYKSWKDYIIWENKSPHQISFEDFLKNKKANS